ncbi:MAG: hypothetical protein KBD78_14975 [Oligoflexales bacterium]|nr:hypothetical protein [Oligoflexales bacterium]
MGNQRPKLNENIYFYLTLSLGFLAALIIGEFGLRLFLKDKNPRVEFIYQDKIIHCYPDDPFQSFSLDLRRAKDYDFFSNILPTIQLSDPLLKDHPSLGRFAHPASTTEPENRQYLEENNPFCLIYETDKNSSRRQVLIENAQNSIALIGDSFAFGQGVQADQTFAAQLAPVLKSNIYNFASLGADNVEIFEQYNQMIPLLTEKKVKTVIYLFVLNDPFVTPELRERQNFVFDFMNRRDYKMQTHFSFAWSRLISFTSQVIKMRQVNSETIRWYHDVFNPQKNPQIHMTFDAISKLEQSAKQLGGNFILAIYPLMDDFRSYRFEKVHRSIQYLTQHYKITTIDLLPAFQAEKLQLPIVHPSDYHPNATAHKLAALYFAERYAALR